ncbi:MAG: EAL domain-containing protein [Gammaproteobacteria bacterium]|nr:EAL domain-containing protein [Gammaproteobacteria bacterium]
MKIWSASGGQRAIRVIGALLGLYLAVITAFGYVGQNRLREALIEQQQLSIEKQATAVGYFLSSQQAVIDDLAESRAFAGYLVNRDRGVSMRDGLQEGLAAMSQDFKRVIDNKFVGGQAVFSAIAFIESDGHMLVEVDRHNSSGAPQAYKVRAPLLAGRLHVDRRDDRVFLVFTAPVIHDDKAIGYIAADVNARVVMQPLLAATDRAAHRLRTAMVDHDDRVIVANNVHAWKDWRTRAAQDGDTLISAKVAGQRFRIVSRPDVEALHGVLVSPMFLAALAFMSVPLLLGVAYLLRLSNHNLVLQTRFQATRQQRTVLRKQNERLQREIDKRVESENQLAHQANYDQLTGLPNRSLAMDRLAQAVKRARRENGPVLVMFLDLDRFKQVNDSLGHAAGDELLREASQRLQAQVRDSDTVSRLGGDEFLVICPDRPNDGDWESLAGRMLKTLSQPFYIGDHEFFIGASIGVAAFPDGGAEPHRLMKNADIAMYAAKEQGRNRYCYYDPSMDAEAMAAMRLDANLRHALARNEFHLLYQPIVDLSSGRTVAVEALLRWTNRELGNVAPTRFIPVAEETGVIHEIGEWVLMQACSDVGRLQPDLDFRVAINLSSKQFSRPGRLLDCMLLALRESGLMPSQLELEITESVIIDDRPEIGEFINQLDRIGVRLSIDDFGTGYSALNYLQRFPFDVLKIDRSFTNDIPDSEASASLIRAIIAMAHALGLEVIAEGIEDRAQTGFLLVHHCELGQGYLYSKPLTLAELRQHLSDERAMSA